MKYFHPAVCVVVVLVFPLVSCGVEATSGNVSAGTPVSESQAADSGCRFATMSEISELSGLRITSTEDRRESGCLYGGEDNSYVKVETFPTATYEQRVRSQLNGQPGTPVPGLGIEAIFASPVVMVKASSDRSFKVLKAPQSGQQPGIEIATFLAPRIAAR